MAVLRLNKTTLTTRSIADKKRVHSHSIGIVSSGIRGTKGPPIKKLLPKWQDVKAIVVNNGRE
jgi:hypothetical protein